MTDENNSNPPAKTGGSAVKLGGDIYVQDAHQIGFSSTYYPKTDAAAIGQFGSGSKIHNTNAVWPFVQLYDLTTGGNVVIKYNNGGGVQTTTLLFDTVDASESLDT
jgi:hypothetical protein